MSTLIQQALQSAFISPHMAFLSWICKHPSASQNALLLRSKYRTRGLSHLIVHCEVRTVERESVKEAAFTWSWASVPVTFQTNLFIHLPGYITDTSILVYDLCITSAHVRLITQTQTVLKSEKIIPLWLIGSWALLIATLFVKLSLLLQR